MIAPSKRSRTREIRLRTRWQARLWPGFTIVELLVVIGMMALILAIAVPALRGAQQRGRKMVEANNIRQVHVAWNLYGNFNRDAAAPGYLDHQTVGNDHVQSAWRVRYEYPVAPDLAAPLNRTIPPEIAAPWTWRLFPYMDHNLETIWQHRDVPSQNWSALVAMARDGQMSEYADVDEFLLAVAEQPGFSYNAYHIGGWWTMQLLNPTDPGGSARPLPRFFNATDLVTGSPIDLVARSTSNIRRADEVILFCTAIRFNNVGHVKRLRDDQYPGSHFVTPPWFDGDEWWVSPAPAADPQPRISEIEILKAPAHAPIGRYNQRVTVLHADGSVVPELPGNIHSQMRWIDQATSYDFKYNPGP